MENIAIFGGSFNPIHNGHINLAIEIKKRLSIDRLILMPACIPPHKLEAEKLADDKDRLRMCRLAAEGLEGFEVSDYEINSGDISYTVYTLRHFKKMYPDARLFFIMGSDMFFSIKTWFCYEEILTLATIITASRKSGEIEKTKAFASELQNNGAKIVVLSISPYEISSTQIRNFIKTGEDSTCYLPKRVVQYISDKKLYRL